MLKDNGCYEKAISDALRADTALSKLLENNNQQYPHMTCRIHTLSEYIDVISTIKRVVSSQEYIEIKDYSIYRGTKNKNYNLQPSLFRLPGYRHETEAELTKSFATLRPEAFDTCSNNFELLAKMQHYGLPTRLLDFSMNPLVALYFACESICEQDDSEDGRVLCHNTNMSLDNAEVIDAICGIHQYNMLDTNEPLERYLRNCDVSVLQYLRCVYLGNPLVARPKYWNQRIKNQSAVFMVFPNDLCDNLSRVARDIHNGRSYEECIGIKPGQEIHDRIYRLLEIEQPQTIYASDGQLYLTSGIWRKILQKYSRQITHLGLTMPVIEMDENNLLDRFVFHYSEKKVEADKLNEDFVSIIIDAQSKPRIRRELESIGIDIAFIYPELEYTAMKLKQKYM